MTAITAKQSAVLNFVEHFIEEKGYSPSYEEIAAGLGLKSVANVHKHVKHLLEKGLLSRPEGKSRALQVVVEAPIGPRFTFESPDRLWDNMENVFWVRETK